MRHLLPLSTLTTVEGWALARKTNDTVKTCTFGIIPRFPDIKNKTQHGWHLPASLVKSPQPSGPLAPPQRGGFLVGESPRLERCGISLGKASAQDWNHFGVKIQFILFVENSTCGHSGAKNVPMWTSRPPSLGSSSEGAGGTVTSRAVNTGARLTLALSLAGGRALRESLHLSCGCEDH